MVIPLVNIITAQAARLQTGKSRSLLVEQFVKNNPEYISEIFALIQQKAESEAGDSVELPTQIENDGFKSWFKKEQSNVESMLKFYQYRVVSLDHCTQVSW